MHFPNVQMRNLKITSTHLKTRIDQTFPNIIRELRFRHGEMTQKELAKHVGVSRQTIMAIEASKYPPSLEIAFRIARCFAASVEDIFFYEPDIEGEDPYKDGLIIEVQMGGDDDDGEQ